MCGIVGAIANREVAPILLEGLKRLEYRGYDSAGMAILDSEGHLERLRALGKVRELENALIKHPLPGTIGIAHTRWATHGKPSEGNAHPHFSHDRIALVHNGIIENYHLFRQNLQNDGYVFASETDSEVVAHLIHQQLMAGNDFMQAVRKIVRQLEGAYALAILDKAQPQRMVAVRSGCPLVIGIGEGEHFLASDCFALTPVTKRFIYLEEGDIADITHESVTIYNFEGEIVKREERIFETSQDAANKGPYQHFMQKEIFEQPEAVSAILEARLGKTRVLEETFGEQAKAIFNKVKQVQIVACGTSYHAGLVARYWLETLTNVSCQVEVASEYRYRKKVVLPNTLFVTISQSGETADTLAALRQAKQLNYLASLSICNVPESSLVRESDLVFMTRAGMEIGVASTKAFTTQLTALLMLTTVLGRHDGMPEEMETSIVAQLKSLPKILATVLTLDPVIRQLAERFALKRHALFLGRGEVYPIALEGALKLKEISYIHAEAYPAGELKHGPLALVDKEMPVIVVAPNNQLLEKLKSNLQEVRARGGELIVFADRDAGLTNDPGVTVIEMPSVPAEIMPIVYTVPLQLLAYHVALIKGTDVDQPRNLAKSVTVE